MATIGALNVAKATKRTFAITPVPSNYGKPGAKYTPGGGAHLIKKIRKGNRSF